MGSQHKPDRRRERGQITVVIAVMALSFLTFFTFVVNTGTLVNAKINLQNAADLAAYAGAAVQARQLNDIGILNYEMRRSYKKFLFRYYLIGGMFQRSLPYQTEKNGLRVWTPDGNPANDLGVPTVCIIFNSQDNYCQIETLKKIPITKADPLDQISVTLEENLKFLEKLRQDHCAELGYTNGQILYLWLYNADPKLEDFKAKVEQAMQASGGNAGDGFKFLAKNISVIQGISEGMGLIPRNVMLSLRIKTLESYLNQKPEKELTLGLVNDMNKGEEKQAHERSIQAFYSAFNTLGEYMFASDSIQMTELLPEGGNNKAELLKLTPHKTDFETYYLDLKKKSEVQDPTNTRPPGGGPNNSYGEDCVPYPMPLPVRGAPIGFTKDPEILTYYAVKLQSKAVLPFSPVGPIMLTAYAAAKPFGSRIGPPIEDSTTPPWVKSGATPKFTGILTSLMGVPNLPIAEGDTTERGWWRTDVQQQYWTYFKNVAKVSGSAGAAAPAVSTEKLAESYKGAMTAHQAERGQYIIPADYPATNEDLTHVSQGDGYASYFANEAQTYALWAPLVSKAAGNGSESPEDLIEQELLETTSAMKSFSAAHRKALSESLREYIQKLRNCIDAPDQTEDGECYEVTQVSNPFVVSTSDGPRPIEVSPTLMLKEAEDIYTHWNGMPDDRKVGSGRVGYSVKVVPFDTLSHPGKDGQTAGSSEFGNAVWKNLPPTGPGTDADLSFIKH